MGQDIKLKRSITLPFLILYGLGTMVGGGFYALLGKVSGEAGLWTPIALGFSGLLALLNGFSFAELSSRFPVSAGEAAYVKEGFGRQGLSNAVGWLVILTGVVSAATLAVATIGFLQDFIAVPQALGILLLVMAMGLLAGWGIGESVGAVIMITVIEVGALIYVSSLASSNVGTIPISAEDLLPPLHPEAWVGIFSGAFLAFYSFLGFEDMVNLAEEVKDVRRVLPLALLTSLLLTTLLYIIVSIMSVLTVPLTTLMTSHTPIAELVKGHGRYSTQVIGVVSIMAGLNGALVQIIMASRVAYGMSVKNQGPAWLAQVHPKTRTPLLATGAMTVVVVILALFFPMTTLARTTSSIILIVFALINLALWRIKKVTPDWKGEGPRYPSILPLMGFTACTIILLFQFWIFISPLTH